MGRVKLNFWLVNLLWHTGSISVLVCFASFVVLKQLYDTGPLTYSEMQKKT